MGVAYRCRLPLLHLSSKYKALAAVTFPFCLKGVFGKVVRTALPFCVPFGFRPPWFGAVRLIQPRVGSAWCCVTYDVTFSCARETAAGPGLRFFFFFFFFFGLVLFAPDSLDSDPLPLVPHNHGWEQVLGANLDRLKRLDTNNESPELEEIMEHLLVAQLDGAPEDEDPAALARLFTVTQVRCCHFYLVHDGCAFCGVRGCVSLYVAACVGCVRGRGMPQLS